MIKTEFEEDLPPEWVESNITDPDNELVIIRKIIPWNEITSRMAEFYDPEKGAFGLSPRITVGVLLLQKLRGLGDERVISQIRENRYMQWFCNVPDDDLRDFMNPSSLCRIRKRLGKEGVAIIESEIFRALRVADVIKGDTMLTDSTVLPADIIYPTDIGLIFKAFGKMRQFAERRNIPAWWDDDEVKTLWREYNLDRGEKKIRDIFLRFATMFAEALRIFHDKVGELPDSDTGKEKALGMLSLLTLLDEQNDEKVADRRRIDNRIVSLDDPEARPIKKGKKHPSCEFGTTLQLSFNRDGFMITVENFIGKPNDTRLWPGTADLFIKRMGGSPEYAVGDRGYRSAANMGIPKDTKHIFLGHSSDVPENKKDYCRKARSATEGFIAVAKNLRGFGRSLYTGLTGDRIWSLLCQAACNLKKFVQLYRNDKIEKKSLLRLGVA